MVTGSISFSNIPAAMAEQASAGSAGESNLDASAYNALGFKNIDAENDTEAFFGKGNTVLMPKKELFLDYNGSSNYGTVLRSGINPYHNGGNLQQKGGYKRYGQYQNGDWAHLDEKNGYNNGQLGGTDLYRNVSSENKHQGRAYATSVAYNMGNGRDSSVATLYIRSTDSNRSNQRIVLELNDFENDGKSRKTRSYRIENGGANYALNEKGYFYSMDYDALFDITAGDYDGDGRDEIAVYAANNKVVIYKPEKSRLRTWKTITNIETETNYTADGDGIPAPKVKRAAIVSLQSYDLDKNNAEDLIITVSNPQGVSADTCKNLNYGYIYSGTASGGIEQKAKIPLYNEQKLLRSASSAAGDFYATGKPVLVFGGRLGDMSNPTKISNSDKIGTIAVEYDHNTKQYNAGEIQSYGEDFNKVLLRDNGVKYNPPIAMEAFNMYGEKDPSGDSPVRLFLFDRLYKYSDGVFVADGTTIDYLSDQKNNADEKENKGQTWISDVVKGNFTKKDIGRREQLIAVVGQRQDNDERYWFQIAYICANGDNVYRSSEGVLNQATGYFNRTDEWREGPYLTISAPDVDNDSMLLEFKGSETYYSKPEVQAIMQSAPFFDDVADVYDDYLNNGATSYGKSESSSKGVSASIETSIGVYTSEEASLGGAAEFEASIAAVASYEHQTTWTKTTEVEYAGGVGDDYVVMYTVPFHRYVYDGYNSVYNSITRKWETQKIPVIIEEPLTPSTVIVTVDKYDEIAKMYSGLEPIRGNVIKSTPGNPASYQSWAKGEFKPIGSTMTLTNAGKGNGATTTVSLTDETDNENSFSVGIEENLKAGGGAGFLGNNVKAGVVQSMTAAVGGVFSNMNGVAYTGTVDSLPEGVEEFGFNWQLGYSKIKFNDEDVIVIGYKTSNVKRPPMAPKNIAITDIGSDFMTIEWDETPDAAVYELSFITTDGQELLLDNIPATMAKDGVLSYTVKNLEPRTTCTFEVRASNVYGARSLPTPRVTGITMAVGDSQFSITKQPGDVEAAAGKDAVFKIEASGDNSEMIKYQWYSYDTDDKAWKKLTGKTSNELKLTVSDEMDGSKYRCTAYQGTKFLNSKSALLTVGLSQSKATLTVSSGGSVLSDGASVRADYEKIVTSNEYADVWRPVTEERGGVTYKKLAAAEAENADDAEISYSYTAPYIWSASADGNTEYYKDDNNSAGGKYTADSKYVFVKDGDSAVTVETEGKITSSLAETDLGSGKKSTKGYKILSGGEYVYIYEYKDTENNDITEYYRKNAGGTYDKYAPTSQETLIKIGETTYNVDSFVEVKEKKSEAVTVSTSQKQAGEKITLFASVLDGSKKITAGGVSFKITDKQTGTVVSVGGVYDDSKKGWTAEYTFPMAGLYSVNAIYLGSDEFYADTSDAVNIYAYGGGNSLSIAGGAMIYGDSLDLLPTLISSGGFTNCIVDYTVKKLSRIDSTVEGKKVVKEEWNTLPLQIAQNIFIPDSVGKYMIVAKYTDANSGEEISAAATVEVSARRVTLSPEDVEGNLSESESVRAEKLKTERIAIDGMSGADLDRLRSSLALRSDATKAKSKGKYTIEISGINSADFADKYTIVANNAVYTIEQSTVTVKADAKANGAVSISYVTDRYNTDGTVAGKSTPLTVESGAQIPLGADVTFTAQPKPGYGVNKWTVTGAAAAPGRENTFTIQNIGQNTEVSVSFSYTLNTVSFVPTDENGATALERGSIEGAYADSTSFESGNSLTSGKTITLTAIPNDGYVLCGWQRSEGNSGVWETLKVSGRDEKDTKLTQKVSDVISPAVYRAMFTQKTDKTLTFDIVDSDNKKITGISVFVNGSEVTDKDENGRLKFTAYRHQNLEIEVKTPDSVLVDYWEAGAKAVEGSNKKTLVYDLQDDTDYIIHCEIPNTRTVTFTAKTADGSPIEGNSVSAKRVGGGDILNGGSQPQSIQIEFTASAQEGWRVKQWNSGGKKILGEDALSYILTVDKSVNIEVIFEKKPKIFINGSEGGATSADCGGEGVSSGSFVEFGSDVTFTFIPESGYILEKVTENGTDITSNLTDVSNAPDSKYYTKADINADVTLEVTYKAKPRIFAAQNEGGALEMKAVSDYERKDIANGGYVDFNTNLILTVKPDKGYVLESIKSNGNDISFTPPHDSDDIALTIENVVSDIQLEITYRALAIYDIRFEVTDVNGPAEEGGTNGTATLNAARKAMAVYEENVTRDILCTAAAYEGGIVTLIANSDPGYRVKEWTIDGTVLKTDEDEVFVGNTLVITPEKLNLYHGKTISVQFEQGAGRITFMQPLNGTITAESAGAPFISGGSAESDVIFTVVPDEHFTVKYWTLDAVPLTQQTDLTYLFAPNGRDASIGAVLEKEIIPITVTSDGNGTVDYPPVTRHGDNITITAAPYEGYEFDGWYKNGVKIENAAASYSFEVLEQASYEARFNITGGILVNYGTNDEALGSVGAILNGWVFESGRSTVTGQEITFTATPQQYCRIKEWRGLPADAVVSADKYTVKITTADSNINITAVFEEIPVYSITLIQPENGSISAKVNGEDVTSVREGTTVTFKAVPDPYYMFDEWSGDAAGESDSTFEMPITSNVTVGAAFKQAVYYAVEYSVIGLGGNVSAMAGNEGLVINTQAQYVGGTKLVFTAAPEDGKMIKEWKINGNVCEGNLSNTLTVTLKEPISVTAEFEDYSYVTLPDDTADFVITDIVKTPQEYGATDRIIRKRGNVEFVVSGAGTKAITALDINASAADNVEITRQNDGKYAVKLTGVKENVAINAATENGVPFTIIAPVNGTLSVRKADNTEVITGSAVAAGEVLTIIATPSSGYRKSFVKVNDNEVQNSTYTVSDTDTAVIVSAGFVVFGGGGGGGGGNRITKIFDVSFETNGGSTVKKQQITEGKTATEPQNPTKTGYTFGGWYKDKDLTSAYDFSAAVSSDMTLFAKWIENGKTDVSDEKPFDDVSKEDWFDEAVNYVYEKGLMNGMSGRTFAPNDNVSRAMFVTVLYRIEKEPEAKESAFLDLEKGGYYENAVSWAVENGIVLGISDTLFAPDMSITREQMAAILYRYASYKGYEGKEKEEINFADEKEISQYALDAVKWLTGNKIILGKDDNTFAPHENSTRAQAAAVFMRILENLK